MNPKHLSRREWMAAFAAGVPAIAATRTQSKPYPDIARRPDTVTAVLEDDYRRLERNGDRWTGQGILIEAPVRNGRIPIRITSEKPLMRVHVRWNTKVPEDWRVLNDAWERSYGDLEWRGMSGDRVLPWYFMAFDGERTHGYGIATQPACFAFWQVDPDGISLWLDVRNGGSAVELGQRTLNAATICSRRGVPGETAFQSARQFCALLCSAPRLPSQPVFGGNNWYYAYGQNCSAADIERDAAFMAEMAPASSNRPFMVIDDGWSVTNTAGPWDHGNTRFPDMPGLAAKVKATGVRPGIWLRPLYTTAQVNRHYVLRSDEAGKVTLDPTVPEVTELVREDIRRIVGWGFELVKHDFSSYDLLGRWGFAMGAQMTTPGWHFADRTKTTAEVALDLYKAIRQAAGDTLLIGCNTFGHLAAGLFELQRTGDDTSGRDFDRTRRMGVNTLAFRAVQQGRFFDLDADCAPITPDVSWALSSQWLDLVARSGTALFVSPDPKAINPDVRRAIKNAFAIAAKPRDVAEPLDWMQIATPEHWRTANGAVSYEWFEADGANPFAS